MPYIYKIINNVNGKEYVGKTMQSIEERWKQHISDATKSRCQDRPLYRAMNKYGVENFSISILEECHDTELTEKEIYWIKTLNTFQKGYNATLGGDGKSYIDYDLIVETYEQLKIQKDVAKVMGISSDTVSSVLKMRGIENLVFPHGNSQRTAKAVIMLSLENKELETFPSITHAAQYLIDNKLTNCCFKTIRYHISEVCQGKRKTTAKFKWRFI